MVLLRCCRYVERAKDIVNIVSPNEVRTNPLIGKLREEIRLLKEWLKQKDSLIVEHEVSFPLKIRSNSSAIISPPGYTRRADVHVSLVGCMRRIE